MASTTTRLRPGIAAVTALALAASLAGCIHLPPAVAAEMQPATPPASNHYRPPPTPDPASPHVPSAP